MRLGVRRFKLTDSVAGLHENYRTVTLSYRDIGPSYAEQVARCSLLIALNSVGEGSGWDKLRAPSFMHSISGVSGVSRVSDVSECICTPDVPRQAKF